MRFVARRLRRTILEMAFAGASVHIACAFSLVEILAVLYRSHLRVNPEDPYAADRDYLVLSKGHGIMAQYACLREIRWITDDDIRSYFADGSRLKGLADSHVPGVEATCGSLGHGLSVGVGLALAAKRRGTGQRCIVIVGDGEINEGPIWEALLFAKQFRLDNLLVIVDANGFQAMGPTAEVMDLGDIAAKFRAFGCETTEVDGHHEPALDAAIASLLLSPIPGPRALIADTVKGKGVSFMEGDNRWHYTRLDPLTYAKALSELAA